MDRVIVYPAAVPLDTDVLQQSKNGVLGLGRLVGMVYGEGVTGAGGFACTPGSGLAVIVQPGMVSAEGVADVTAYGSLPADSTPIPIQYLSLATNTLGGMSAGSTYYLYATLQLVDSGQLVLPFYNANNPSQTLAGQNNNGVALPTARQALAVLAVATTVPTGGVLLYTITIPSGATAITQAMIVQATSGPFYPTIPQLKPGRLIKRTIFPVGTTLWTPDPRTTLCKYRQQADGGSGGGTPALASSATTGCAATGGGSGAYDEGEFTINPAVPNSSIAIAVVVGAGGAAPAANATNPNNGNPGTSSSIGTRVCPGGVGGASGSPQTPPYINFLTQAAGFPSGTGITTGINTFTPYFSDPGDSPGDGIIMSITNIRPGKGGSAFTGHGGFGQNTLARGGGGAGCATQPGGAAAVGSAGAIGFVQIDEYT